MDRRETTMHVAFDQTGSFTADDLLAMAQHNLVLDADSRQTLRKALPAALAEIHASFAINEQGSDWSDTDGTYPPQVLCDRLVAWAHSQDVNVD
jgi:hypothetical protein